VSALFLKGLLFGFLLAASVGPMWVLCFRRTLDHGPAAGFTAGMGVAVADGFYGAVAAFGLTAISGVLLRHSFWIGFVGGLFLIYLAMTMLLSRPELSPERSQPAGLARGFLATLGMTLANPPTILAFAAIFAGLGLVNDADYLTASLITLAIFLGSAAWWLILAGSAHWLRHRISAGILRGINIVSGLTVLGFALWQLAALLR
jgi:threonine/homoserine/homoserine lactone efflux protein